MYGSTTTFHRIAFFQIPFPLKSRRIISSQRDRGRPPAQMHYFQVCDALIATFPPRAKMVVTERESPNIKYALEQ